MRMAAAHHIRHCDQVHSGALTVTHSEMEEEIHYLNNEVFAWNVDLDFTHFPDITISHNCTWVGCSWTQEKTITMIEASE